MWYKNQLTDHLLSPESIKILEKINIPDGASESEGKIGLTLIKNMLLLEDAAKRGNLAYAVTFIEKHRDDIFNYNIPLKFLLNQSALSRDFFEPVWSMIENEEYLTFKLKVGVNASDGLLSLLSGINFIGCRSATCIARWFTVLDFNVAQHGQEAGVRYFNDVYGSSNRMTSPFARFSLNKMGELSGSISSSSSSLSDSAIGALPISPLMYHSGYVPEAMLDHFGVTASWPLKLGDSVTFLNHPRYSELSPASNYLSLDTLYCGKNDNGQDVYIGFGFHENGSSEPQTDCEIKQLLHENIAKPSPYYAQLMSTNLGGSIPDSMLCLHPHGITLEMIPGIDKRTIRRFHSRFYESLGLSALELSGKIERYCMSPDSQNQDYLAICEQAQKMFLGKHFLDAPASSSVDNLADSLSGLHFRFTLPKPAPKPIEKPAERAESSYEWMKPGFFN